MQQIEIITWIHLENDKISGVNSNPYIKKALEYTNMSLFGDAELSIYIIKDWKGSLIEFASYIKKTRTGWIKTTKLEAKPEFNKRLTDLLCECGIGFEDIKDEYYTEAMSMIKNELQGSIWNIWLPAGHFQCIFNECISIDNNGNFKMYAARISNTFYLICFATS